MSYFFVFFCHTRRHYHTIADAFKFFCKMLNCAINPPIAKAKRIFFLIFYVFLKFCYVFEFFPTWVRRMDEWLIIRIARQVKNPSPIRLHVKFSSYEFPLERFWAICQSDNLQSLSRRLFLKPDLVNELLTKSQTARNIIGNCNFRLLSSQVGLLIKCHLVSNCVQCITLRFEFSIRSIW